MTHRVPYAHTPRSIPTFSVDLPFAHQVALIGDKDDGGAVVLQLADVLQYLDGVLEGRTVIHGVYDNVSGDVRQTEVILLLKQSTKLISKHSSVQVQNTTNLPINFKTLYIVLKRILTCYVIIKTLYEEEEDSRNATADTAYYFCVFFNLTRIFSTYVQLTSVFKLISNHFTFFFKLSSVL